MMDCRQAQDALAAAHDGCEPDDATITARAHAATCPECAGYSAALAELDAIPAPEASPLLAERIVRAVANEAAVVDRDAEVALAAAALPRDPTATGDGAVPAPVSDLPAWLTRTRLWAATGTVILAAASVMVAVIVSGQAADQAALREMAKDGPQAGAVTDAEVAGTPTPPAPGAIAPSAPATVPDYVAYQSFAYLVATAVEATPSQATTLGTTQTALRSGAVQTLSVLQVPGSGRDLLLVLPAGEHRALKPVIRSYGSRTFQMRSGTSLDRFGIWPTLPEGYTQPTGADGSPYYRAAGTDALGVRVYVRVGQTPEFGFGIAGGTASTDPASGNPNWTWWSPIQ
ncbi:MAG: hypothetical protein Q7W16_02520 [Coriobacteriia bacterium]|nr:hypothetical protein [Coriobacteriia bacterium]